MGGKKVENIHPANISLVPWSVQTNKTQLKRGKQTKNCIAERHDIHTLCIRCCGGTKEKVIFFG